LDIYTRFSSFAISAGTITFNGDAKLINVMSTRKLAILEGRQETRKEKQYNSIGLEEANAVARVMGEGVLSDFIGRAGDKFLGGKYVKRLENDFQDFFQIKHAVSFNSATTALQAAVAALGVGPGDEIITSPFTMSATATAILLNNAIPVFADIDPGTYCLDPESVRSKISPKTKAIITVNLLGGSADYSKIVGIAKEYSLRIIEDNAQSPACKYNGKYTGTIGDIGVFSLNVHKAIQCGEGGVLVTNDDGLAFRSQLVRNHGEVVMDDLKDEKEFEPVVGSNYRMSEIHAAIAIEQLKKLNSINDARRKNATYLTESLAEIKWLSACMVPDSIEHVYYVYPIKFLSEKIGISRETFVRAMKAEGFNLGVGLQKPLYLFPMYQRKRMFLRSQFPFVSEEYPSDVSYAKGQCPVAERMYEKEMLITTIFQHPNTTGELDLFVDTLQRIESQVDDLKDYEQNN